MKRDFFESQRKKRENSKIVLFACKHEHFIGTQKVGNFVKMQQLEDVVTPQFIDHYEFKGTIGKGSFSVVKMIADTVTGQLFAAKVVPRAQLGAANLAERFESEIRIIQQLRHPGIVQLYDLLKDDNNFYIIMELCSNGELFQQILENQRLSELESKYYMKQILEALSYIHNLGICHRDIKPENILIDEFNHAKISDFGLSRFVTSAGLAKTPCGSPCYASPECIRGGSYDGRKSDMWSCGVVCFAMLTGQLPWTKRNQTQLFEQIARADFIIPTYVSEPARRFIRALMDPNPELRLDVEQALHHQWIVAAPSSTMETNHNLSVSLRQVDRFFGRDSSETALGEIPIYRCSSVVCGPIERSLGVDKEKEKNPLRQTARATANQLLFKRHGMRGNTPKMY